MNRKDLIVLAADKDMEHALKGLLSRAAGTGYSDNKFKDIETAGIEGRIYNVGATRATRWYSGRPPSGIVSENK